MKKLFKKTVPFFAFLFAVIFMLQMVGCKKENEPISTEPAPAPLPQEASLDNGLLLQLNEDGASYTVKGVGSCTDSVVVIPDTYQSAPITAIGASAFNKCETLGKIEIPNSVTTIGNSAFKQCTWLCEVTFGTGLKSIGDSAFYGCSALEKVILPDGLTSIGESAFISCQNLWELTVPGSLTSLGDYAFNACPNIQCLTAPICVLDAISSKEKMETVVITGGEVLRSNAFKNADIINAYRNPNLESLVLSEGVTRIEAEAVKDCNKLANLSLPDSLTFVGENAFYGCSKLPYHNRENGVYLGNAQNPCVVLMDVTVSSATSFEIAPETRVIYGYALKGCEKLTSITIPSNVKSIGHHAFSYCTGLTSITIPESVTTIENFAFDSCSNLESVTMSKNVETLGVFVFMGCHNLKSIHFDGLKSEWEEMTKDINLGIASYTVYCTDGTIEVA